MDLKGTLTGFHHKDRDSGSARPHRLILTAGDDAAGEFIRDLCWYANHALPALESLAW